MPNNVYILYSKKLNRFYVGHTLNLVNRLTQHYNGESTYSSQGTPWTLLWSTTKSNLQEAENLELKIKNLSRDRKITIILKYANGIKNQHLTHKLINNHL